MGVGGALIAPETLTRFVYDAGFEPRWIEAVLVGNLEEKSAGDSFIRPEGSL